jgi:hypothetical protein
MLFNVTLISTSFISEVEFSFQISQPNFCVQFSLPWRVHVTPISHSPWFEYPSNIRWACVHIHPHIHTHTLGPKLKKN